jgi:hypothetical protein
MFRVFRTHNFWYALMLMGYKIGCYNILIKNPLVKADLTQSSQK